MDKQFPHDPQLSPVPSPVASSSSSSSSSSFVEVEGRVVPIDLNAGDGRQILTAADCEPADDFILIQVLHHETRSIALEQVVQLGIQNKFVAFRGDRLYRFTINDRGFDWGDNTITETQLRAIYDLPESEIFVLGTFDGDEITILNLDHAGTEHVYTAKRLLTVFYCDEPRQVPRGIYTTEQLIQLFAVDAGYLLNVIDVNGQIRTLKQGDRVKLHEGQKFFKQVSHGASA
jgi:hypothetical protein